MRPAMKNVVELYREGLEELTLTAHRWDRKATQRIDRFELNCLLEAMRHEENVAQLGRMP